MESENVGNVDTQESQGKAYYHSFRHAKQGGHKILNRFNKGGQKISLLNFTQSFRTSPPAVIKVLSLGPCTMLWKNFEWWSH